MRSLLPLIVALMLPAVAAHADDAKPPKIVVITAEHEYDAKTTLPAFFKAHVDPKLAAGAVFINSDSTTDIPGLDALDDADLLVLYVRRRTLPEAQLAKFKDYLKRGKPLIALRTSSHAFETWKTFDRDVLGCQYNKHYGKELATKVTVADAANADHPILRGVRPFESKASLYKSAPLAKAATPLLTGTAGNNPTEPVAWTNTRVDGGRVFYTSLGHAADFEQADFRQLLNNAIAWCSTK